MRIALSLVFIVLAAANRAGSTGESSFGGTFIGAIVCDAGIVVASDSRSTFIDADGRQFGYVDGMPKIFARQSTAFAVSGLTTLKTELFDSFVRRNEFLLDRPVKEILIDVALYLPFQNTTSVLLLSAGFVDGRPTICAKSPTDPQACRDSGYITNKESASLRRWHADLRGTPPKKEDAARALKQAIAEFSAADVTVGGPTSTLYLPKTGMPQWIENGTRDRGWTSICDIVKDYRQGKVSIGFTNSKPELDRFLAAACPAA